MYNISFDSYYGEGNLDLVDEFERREGFELPAKYKEIVSKYNGVFILDRNLFRFYNRLYSEYAEYDAGVFLIYGEVEGVTESMDIMNRDFRPDGLTEGLVIFSALGNGDALCFDYRNTKTAPAVVVWHHQGSPVEGSEISRVAESFSDFLDNLYEGNVE